VKEAESSQDNVVLENVKVSAARLPQRSDEIILAIGDEILKGAIKQGIDFNKVMLGYTATFTTLMASIFALLVFGAADVNLAPVPRLLLVIPVFLMLMSSCSFAAGYFPRNISFNPQILSSIESARTHLVNTRQRFALIGLLLFIFSIVSLLIAIMYLNVP
jgi:hypothetical protein